MRKKAASLDRFTLTSGVASAEGKGGFSLASVQLRDAESPREKGVWNCDSRVPDTFFAPSCAAHVRLKSPHLRLTGEINSARESAALPAARAAVCYH